MPIGWKSVTSKIEEAIAEEQAKIDAVQSKRQWRARPVSPVETVSEAPTTQTLPVSVDYQSPQLPEQLPVSADYTPPQLPNMRQWQTPRQTAVMERPVSIQKPEPVLTAQVIPKAPKETPVSVPFWQRALQVFAAPFDWVSETLIKPIEATAGTALGFVPELARQPGEDFWEWKKRSWAGWESPGVKVNVPWSKEPMTIDVRGVMEFAPWLLIPGAGQVGGGVRGASGVAGMLGKLGTAGRVLGTAVEYSPWGIAEKTAGVAIKAGAKGIVKAGEKTSTAVGEKLFGKYVPPPVAPEVVKLTQYFSDVVMPSFRQFRKALPQELRSQQEATSREVISAFNRGEFPASELKGRIREALSQVGGIKSQFTLTKEALAVRQSQAIADVQTRMANKEISEQAGNALITKLERSPAYTPMAWTTEEATNLTRQITQGVESGLEKQESATALIDLLMNGTLPERAQIRDWARVYGNDFAKAVGQLYGKPQATINTIIDTLNIGRSIQSSLDLSGTLRQGMFMTIRRPLQAPVWFGRQVKALFSEKLALERDAVLRAKPNFNSIVDEMGVYFRPMTNKTWTTAEESFPSQIASRVPGVRRSERAFNTYLNEGSYATAEAAYNVLKARGAAPQQFKLMGEFINKAAGRGTLPKAFDKYAPALNVMFYSPRLQAATIELPRTIGRMLLSSNPYMRKEGALALTTFVGGGATLLTFLNAMGHKVELDPRSVDFGKIKVGDTRLDIWRGYLQYARFAAQMLTGEQKSAYGNMSQKARSETVWRFLQSKSSPAMGLMVDLFRNETYDGKPIFNDTTGFTQVAKNRLIPLATQDVIDAMEQSGINGMWVAAPSTLGIGALTFVNDYARIQDRIAKENGFKNWESVDPKTQREIQNRSAELQAATIAFDRQIMGTAWGDWRQAGTAIDDIFRQDVENATNQYRQSTEPNRGVTFREDISDAFMKRRGGLQARSQESRFSDIVNRLEIKDTTQAMIVLSPEQTAIKIYNDALYGDDMYDEFGDYRFDEANLRKEQLKQQLGDEMFQYVEDYSGLKFANLSPEFQALADARTILKPYWGVADQVARLFGQTYAGSQAGQTLIARRRKQMRLSNREIAQAYDRFYASK